MLIIEFKILDKDWKIRLLGRKKYVKKHGNKSLALAKGWKREIDVHPNGVSVQTLIHELVHAYLNEMCLLSADLTVENLEEIFAELMAKRGRELLDLSDELMVQINTLTQAQVTMVRDTKSHKDK